MSKALELLKQIRRVDGNMSREQNQRYAELEKALTPPTEDEVCVALSEWLKKENPYLRDCKVYHDDGGFHYNDNKGYENYLVEYDDTFEMIFFPRYLPPHLIEMISKFYENLEDLK